MQVATVWAVNAVKKSCRGDMSKWSPCTTYMGGPDNLYPKTPFPGSCKISDGGPILYFSTGW
ncbi:hypothetical protein CY34DRAFT_807096 [Suillus luteus UH-Slu-Lm8-n1]|uniref:Uncharacterized protein n=1 Tax=Suillus luteus UH-Slu-Lm8-n1 TaxID=930992 RepID=A0A0D0BAG6_9AGAM|nr:hypothetical protein CY34DRAFT_807096 [Suillus luteus UH-Slu-Lm8-n1]